MGLSVQCNRAKYFFCKKEKKIDLCPHCSQCWKTEKADNREKWKHKGAQRASSL